MENMNEMMEQAIEAVGENVAEATPEITFEAPEVVTDTTDIVTNVAAAEPHFGVKEGVTLAALIVGGGCVIYTGIDIFKKIKAKAAAKKAEKIAVAKAIEDANLAEAAAEEEEFIEEPVDEVETEN